MTRRRGLSGGGRNETYNVGRYGYRFYRGKNRLVGLVLKTLIELYRAIQYRVSGEFFFVFREAKSSANRSYNIPAGRRHLQLC